MKNLTFICLLLFQFSCYTAKIQSSGEDYKCRIEKTEDGDCEEGIIRNTTTKFPETSPAGDYQVKGYQIKMAFPIDGENSRIWVKGNENLRYVQAFSRQAQALNKAVLLEPPFYTAILAIPASYKEAEVKFAVDVSGLPEADKVLVAYPKSKRDLEKEEDQFSLLFYGCFQPFRVNPDTKLGEVLHEKDTLNYVIRQVFEAVGSQKEFSYQPYQQTATKTEKLLSNPKLVIGGGDQVYTDAGYEEKDFKDHPLSAWAHQCSDPYPLLDTLEYARHLDRCYYHFNAFSCFESTFSKLPLITTWDDHEIRDGWGSH